MDCDCSRRNLKVSGHCGDDFCSVGDVCFNGAEGSEDGRVNELGKVQKGSDDFLETVFFGVQKSAAMSRLLWLTVAGLSHIGGPSRREALRRVLGRCLRRKTRPHFFDVTGHGFFHPFLGVIQI